jgi:hypothetical protein
VEDCCHSDPYAHCYLLTLIMSIQPANSACTIKASQNNTPERVAVAQRTPSSHPWLVE